MSSIVDGRVAKLRASCDACNESKVRCSQKKPRCTRCEKHDLLCVYGLSRRSHKNAPRIGASQEASHTAPPSPPSDTTALPPPMSPNTVNNDARAHSVSQNDLVSADEHELLASSIQSPGSRLYADELGLAFNQLTEFSLPPESTSHDFLNFALTSPHVHDSSGFIHYDFPIERGQPDGAACNCVSRLITELASLPSVSGASFDAQLSQLRRIINVSEGCISCNCTSQDEMSIMTTSILIGRVIQGLESSLIRTASSSSSSTSSSNNSNNIPVRDAPRLSWGELQIDPDEENQLKQHLWLLQFRKLERVIEEFNQSVRRLTGSASGGQSAFVMACQCIHMWLTQKADVLKSRYHSQVGDPLQLTR